MRDISKRMLAWTSQAYSKISKAVVTSLKEKGDVKKQGQAHTHTHTSHLPHRLGAITNIFQETAAEVQLWQ